MKSYTDIEQSKKLAEILPLESADMSFVEKGNAKRTWYDAENRRITTSYEKKYYVPCWSLAALLDVLPYPQLSKDKLGSGKEGWMVSVYPDNRRVDSCWHDNPVDTCYEMILKLHDFRVIKLLVDQKISMENENI